MGAEWVLCQGATSQLAEKLPRAVDRGLIGIPEIYPVGRGFIR